MIGIQPIETLVTKIDNRIALELSFEAMPRPDVNRHHPEGSLFSGFRVLLYHPDIQYINKYGQLFQSVEIDFFKFGLSENNITS